MERMKKGGGGVSSSYAGLKKDWITAARKVSANTNSPWAHKHCLTPFRATHTPATPPATRTHLNSNNRIYTQDYVCAELQLTPCTSHHLATRD